MTETNAPLTERDLQRLEAQLRYAHDLGRDYDAFDARDITRLVAEVRAAREKVAA